MADLSGNLSEVGFEGEPRAKVFSAFWAWAYPEAITTCAAGDAGAFEHTEMQQLRGLVTVRRSVSRGALGQRGQRGIMGKAPGDEVAH